MHSIYLNCSPWGRIFPEVTFELYMWMWIENIKRLQKRSAWMWTVLVGMYHIDAPDRWWNFLSIYDRSVIHNALRLLYFAFYAFSFSKTINIQIISIVGDNIMSIIIQSFLIVQSFLFYSKSPFVFRKCKSFRRSCF